MRRNALLLNRDVATQRLFLGDLALDALGSRCLGLEVANDALVERGRFGVHRTVLDERRLIQYAELLDPVELVLDRVVVLLAFENDALVPREMMRVDRDAVVVLGATGTDAAPVPLLLAEVETGRVGEEESRAEHAEGTERNGEPVLGAVVDVTERGSRDDGASLAPRSRESVGGTANRSREDLGSDEERDAVRAELVPERREVVHEGEGLDGRAGLLELVEEDAGKEVDQEVEREPDELHLATSVGLVVDEDESHVVTGNRAREVDHVPLPGHDDRRAGLQDLDEQAGEDLGAVEAVGGVTEPVSDMNLARENEEVDSQDVVGEPTAGSREKATPEVRHEEAERVRVVAGRVLATLDTGDERVGVVDLEDTVVKEPEVNEDGETELNTVGRLGRLGAESASLLTAREDEDADEKDGLVEDLSPACTKSGWASAGSPRVGGGQ